MLPPSLRSRTPRPFPYLTLTGWPPLGDLQEEGGIWIIYTLTSLGRVSVSTEATLCEPSSVPPKKAGYMASVCRALTQKQKDTKNHGAKPFPKDSQSQCHTGMREEGKEDLRLRFFLQTWSKVQSRTSGKDPWDPRP